ncbi:MAG: hypothetical protein KAW47_06765 [Thermoplasmatales archaeon]|nr:hypothetical protein [Thermoplasmatales archaeon]
MRKFLSIVMAGLLVAIVFNSASVYADTSNNGDFGMTPFADGSGTCADPYQITTIEELDAIHGYLDRNFTLMHHLDFEDDTSYADPDNKNDYITGNGWLPLGDSGEGGEFTGSFDGQQHKISNLFINRSSTVYSSLFGYILNAEISNLGLIDVYVTGRNAVGSFAGRSWRSSISDCYATGYVQGAWYYVGGLVGGNNGSISDCHASVEITGNCYIGGLVGCNEGSISDSFATGDVIGKDFDEEIRNVGGLVGGNDGSISDSYATGNVTGNRYVGGLTGCNWDSISGCYAKGTVTGIWDNGISVIDVLIGRWFLGRLAGANFGSISDSYATGRINRRLFVEGLFWHIIYQLFPNWCV